MTRFGVLLLPLVIGAAFGAEPGVVLKAGVFEPARLAPHFTLRGSNGGDATLSRYRGKLVLLAFGCISCIEVCRITMAVLARARLELGAAGADLQVLYVARLVPSARDRNTPCCRIRKISPAAHARI